MSFSSEETLYDLDQLPQAKVEVDTHGPYNQTDNEDLTGASALTVRQSIIPLCSVISLYFLRGFTYGLTTVLNAKFQAALDIPAAKVAGLQGAYFGAYFICPLTWSGWMVRLHGYRWSLILGLCLYGIGSLMFWPSAVYKSLAGLCVSLFIVGSGLSTLETSADPYVTTCGPPRLSELRIMIATGVATMGIIIARLLASRVFYKDTEFSDISNVQWTYIGIAAVAFSIAVLFFIFPLPEITDADMAHQAVQCSNFTGHSEKPLSEQYKLFFGVVALFCYFGGQVTIDTQFINYTIESTGVSSNTAADRFAILQILFAIGRFTSAGLFTCIRPRLVLFVFAFGVVVSMACTVGVYGKAGLAMISLVLFFESCVLGSYVSLTLRGLGRHSKRGASWLVAARSGGALLPALTGLVADRSNYHMAMVVPLVAHSISFLYPIYLNTVCAKELDGFRKSKLGYHDEKGNIVGKDGDIETEEKGQNATCCPPV